MRNPRAGLQTETGGHADTEPVPPPAGEFLLHDNKGPVLLDIPGFFFPSKCLASVCSMVLSRHNKDLE